MGSILKRFKNVDVSDTLITAFIIVSFIGYFGLLLYTVRTSSRYTINRVDKVEQIKDKLRKQNYIDF